MLVGEAVSANDERVSLLEPMPTSSARPRRRLRPQLQPDHRPERPIQGGLEFECLRSTVFFTWTGFDDVDEVSGSGTAELQRTARSRSRSQTRSGRLTLKSILGRMMLVM